MERPTQDTLDDLLAELAAVSDALDDAEQRFHGHRAGTHANVDLVGEHAQIRSLRTRQAALRRAIVASRDWSHYPASRHAMQ